MDYDSKEFILFGVAIVTVCLSLRYMIPLALKWLWEHYIVTSISYEEHPDLKLPPGTLGYPLIGETLQFLRKVCIDYLYNHYLRMNETDIPFGTCNI